MTLEILKVIILACSMGDGNTKVIERNCLSEVKHCIESRQHEASSIEEITVNCIQKVVLF